LNLATLLLFYLFWNLSQNGCQFNMSRNVISTSSITYLYFFFALISQSGCKSTTSFLSHKYYQKFFEENLLFFFTTFLLLNLIMNLSPFREGKDNYFFISSKFLK
jgi:hypothetical protein